MLAGILWAGLVVVVVSLKAAGSAADPGSAMANRLGSGGLVRVTHSGVLLGVRLLY